MGALPEVSRRIVYIYRTFYREASNKKLLHIMDEGLKAAAALKLDPQRFDWWIDRHRVGEIVTSYFFDVIKYKEYHFNPKSDPEGKIDPTSIDFLKEIHARHVDSSKDKVISTAKVAAFTAKWLMKYMPIYIFPKPDVTPSLEERDKLNNANVYFAIDHSLGLMKRKAIHLPDDILDDLFYHLKYRSTDDRTLILAFSILNKL